ncbi:MAG: T9SS type A sorting domain-containing protein [Bacteroidales bacterium]|nr:T9SS type A sorting domain-containing protein [Bacteroidales bacterium]
MKKLLFAICLMATMALNAQEVAKTYYFNSPQIVDHNGYILVEFPGTMQSAVLGNPMMPYCASQLLLPPGYEASDVELEFGKLIQIEAKGEIFPKQPVRPYSADPITDFYKNEEVYNSKAAYPAKASGVLSTGFYKGHSIANVAFTPVVYIPADNSIAYYESVTVKVSAKRTEKAENALKLLKSDNNMARLVDNVEAERDYQPLVNNTKDASDYDMLIISKPQYESNFDTLISMYRDYGIFAQFKSLDAIYSEMTGVDNQAKIRNYIIQEYTNHSIEYVLLGGDVDVFPYRGFYCTVQSSSVYESNDIPADIYFSGLDGTWNSDNDSHWGEIGEDDLYMEVSVARMPFSNSTELNRIIHKSTSYQLNPVLGELRKHSFFGEWMYSNPDTYGSDYLDLLIGHHEDNGYTTDGVPEDYNLDFLYAQYTPFNSTAVKAHINAGPNFIHHAGHASETTVMELYSSDINNNSFYGPNGINHNYTFVYTHGCDCGAFDYSDCITEKMVTIDNFAAGVTANSRYGWFNEGQTEGPSAHLNREFVDALFNDRYSRYGMAQKESKTATAPWVNAPGQFEEGALRWCFYDSNAMTDPAIQVWTDEPYNLSVGHTNFIHPTDETFHVVVYNLSKEGFEAGARIVLMYDNEVIGRGITDAEGECQVAITGTIPQSGEVDILVSSYNTFVCRYQVTINGSTLVGDANIDGVVSVLDIATVVAYIAEQNPNPFCFDLADVNSDGQINVIDVVGIVNVIFGRYNLDECENNTATYSIEDGCLIIDSPVDLAGVQIILSDSATAIEDVFSNMMLIQRTMHNGNYMFMAYSNDCRTIAAGRHSVLNIGDSEISKVILSDKFGCEVPAYAFVGMDELDKASLSAYPNPFDCSQTVSYRINGAAQSVNFVVVNSLGQIVDRFNGDVNGSSVTWNPNNLANGLYFINMYVDGTLNETIKVVYSK